MPGTASFSNHPSHGKFWRSAAAAVPGQGHIERGLPCQDRAAAWTRPRPALVALDGRGSASLSHEGAEAAIGALRRELKALEDRLGAILDGDDVRGLAALSWQGLAQWLYTVAARVQCELAAQSDENTPSDYEFTLSLAVVGARWAGWMSVGDSPLVACRTGILFLPCRLETPEFANQTRFVQASPGRSPGLSGGLIPAEGLDLLAAMSDGAASRLIDLRGQVPAEAVRQLGALLVGGELDESALVALLEDGAWDEATRDDRCLALLAKADTGGEPAQEDALPPAPVEGAAEVSGETRAGATAAGLQTRTGFLDRAPFWLPFATQIALAWLLWTAAMTFLAYLAYLAFLALVAVVERAGEQDGATSSSSWFSNEKEVASFPSSIRDEETGRPVNPKEEPSGVGFHCDDC